MHMCDITFGYFNNQFFFSCRGNNQYHRDTFFDIKFNDFIVNLSFNSNCRCHSHTHFVFYILSQIPIIGGCKKLFTALSSALEKCWFNFDCEIDSISFGVCRREWVSAWMWSEVKCYVIKILIRKYKLWYSRWSLNFG